MLEIKPTLNTAEPGIKAAVDSARNLRPLMREFRGILHDEVEQNFERQGRPSLWVPLSRRTTAARTKRGTWPGKILQERGSLASSVTPGSDATSAWVSTNKEYAKIHHFGGTIKRDGKKGTVRLRATRGGALMRQGDAGRLAIFAKATHKRVIEKQFEGKPYEIKIPARPFMVVTQSGEEAMLSAAAAFVLSARPGGTK